MIQPELPCEPIMLRIPNSPTYRSGTLLCSESSRRAQSVNRPLGHPPRSQPLEPSGVGERGPSTLSTFMAPMVVPDRTFQYYPVDLIAPQEFYTVPTPLSMHISHVPQFPGPCFVSGSGFAADAYDPFQPTYLEDLMDVEGMFSEPSTAHQPPPPPSAPEHTVPLAFHYHSCRWLSGPQCDGLAPGRNREMGEHLRVFHRFIGHERDKVQCKWEDCGQVMQRMNVSRHIVSRHLLAAATCRLCGKRFCRPDVVTRHERTCTESSPVSSGSVPTF